MEREGKRIQKKESESLRRHYRKSLRGLDVEDVYVAQSNNAVVSTQVCSEEL